MPVNQISEQGSATQGVKLIRVDEGDEIAAITQLDEKEVAEEILLDEAGNPIVAETTDEDTKHRRTQRCRRPSDNE